MMTKPNFEAMNKTELRAYVLTHRDDQEAFEILADRITSSPNSVKYPASMTPEEMQQAVLELLRKKQIAEE